MARDDGEYGGGWPPYVPVAERRRKAARVAERLRRKGQVLAPVAISGRAIATTAWGKAWCDNLESYRDYESRLPRGRTYVRNGSVLDLQVEPGEVTALVMGSELYRVTVKIGRVPAAAWRRIRADCAGRIDSVVELLQGRLAKGVMERLCRQEAGLFPRPSEIRFACSCPDHAALCKHVAAVLYGVGARLDQRPELLFRLRAVDEADLVGAVGTDLPMAKAPPVAGKVLPAEDVAALFGLEMAAATPTASGQQPGTAKPPRRRPPPAMSKLAPRVSGSGSPGEAGEARGAEKRGPVASRKAERERTPAAPRKVAEKRGTASRKGAAKAGPAAGRSAAESSAARPPKAGRPRAVVGGDRSPATAADEPAGSRRRSAAPRPAPTPRGGRAR